MFIVYAVQPCLVLATAHKESIQSDLLVVICGIVGILLLALNDNVFSSIIIQLLLGTRCETTLIDAVALVACQHLMTILLEIPPKPWVLIGFLDTLHRNLVFRLSEVDIIFALVVVVDDPLSIRDHVHRQSFVPVAFPQKIFRLGLERQPLSLLPGLVVALKDALLVD